MDRTSNLVVSSAMISTDLSFLGFLETLEGKNRAEIILSASRERRAAKDMKVKRGDKSTERKLIEYISDLGSFLYFVRNSDNSGVSWPEAFLTSPEWRHTQRFRYGDLLQG
jgi:hypothetical protein